jgi:hypothetical protein
MAARPDGGDIHIDVDLEHAQREADRVRAMLEALRRRHDLSRYEYTKVVRIVPGGDTFARPILTLGNRFADSEDLLLSTYLHEQMHWYLWYLGTPERDMLEPFYDELVRRYPQAPVELPDGTQLRCDLFPSRRQLAGDRGDIRVHWTRARLQHRQRAAQLPLDLPHGGEGFRRARRVVRAPWHPADPDGARPRARKCEVHS